MHIRVAHYGLIQVENGSISSSFASIRYRAIMPALELAKLGHTVSFLEVNGVGRKDLESATDVSHLIFTKLIAPPDFAIIGELQRRSLAIAEKAVSKGVMVVTDFSDDHFDTDSWSVYYSRLIELSTKLTVCSGVLAAVVAKRTSKEIIVISDPVESSRQPPRFHPPPPEKSLLRIFPFKRQEPQNASLKLLWYGHPSNLAPLKDFFPALEKFSRTQPVSLNIVTDLEAAVFQKSNPSGFPSSNSLSVTFTSWSISATWQAISECDIVIIPSFSGDKAKLAKSPNRLAEAMWCGRFVVSSAIPTYKAFRNWAWVDDDLIEGIAWAIKHPRDVVARIHEAQEYIHVHHSPEVITNNWLSVLSLPVTGVSSNMAGESLAPERVSDTVGAGALKLNLGCGDKILEGYINVDIAPSRSGKRPDIICDLRNLAVFKPDTVSEILSIHVFEHFWRWEVDDILREWIRVLKPNGVLILECPNLISACEALLADPVVAAGEGNEGQRSMWVFYGDPKWRDPLMVHRWGYTPDSLSRLLRKSGLINVRQEPAQFKLREPRDMRIVGEKPAMVS